MTDDEMRLLAIYEMAVSALTPLPRAAYLMWRVDDLPHREIAATLAMGLPLAQSCMAHALGVIADLIDDLAPPPTPACVIEAEAALLELYRVHCRNTISRGAKEASPRLSGQAMLKRVTSFDEWLRTGRPCDAIPAERISNDADRPSPALAN